MDWVDNLKVLKKGTGKTNQEIANISGIPKSTVDKVFSGHAKNPNLDTIRGILNAMGYNLNALSSFDSPAGSVEAKEKPAIEDDDGLTRSKQELISLIHTLSDEQLDQLYVLVKAALQLGEK